MAQKCPLDYRQVRVATQRNRQASCRIAGYFGGSDKANSSPRSTQFARSSSDEMPSTPTTTNPRIGLPVKSISRAWGKLRRIFVSLRSHAHDNLVAHHAAQHIAMRHEAKPAEHLALHDARLLPKRLPNTQREFFVVRQSAPRFRLFRRHARNEMARTLHQRDARLIAQLRFGGGYRVFDRLECLVAHTPRRVRIAHADEHYAAEVALRYA